MEKLPPRIAAHQGVTIPNVMDYEDLSFYLGLGISTLHEMVANYLIPFFEPTPGRKRFFKPAIDKWIENQMIWDIKTHSMMRDGRRKLKKTDAEKKEAA